MYFVTVSEMFGTNGNKIARDAAAALNYPYYGKEALFKAAEEMGVLEDVEKVHLKDPPLLERYFSDKPKIYLDRFQAVIYEVAKKGNALFFGKGSQVLLQSFDCAIHVLIVGSMENRIKRVMEDQHVDREIAEKMVHTSDHDKKGFVRHVFDRDWLDPHLYDLMINVDKLGTSAATSLIVGAVKSAENKTCGEDVIKTLGMLSLQRKVESALLEAGVMSFHLIFSVESPDTVRLRGVVVPEEKRKIERVVKSIKDVKQIKNELVTRSEFID